MADPELNFDQTTEWNKLQGTLLLRHSKLKMSCRQDVQKYMVLPSKY